MVRYEVHYWPVEMVKEAMEQAGFHDVQINRLELNPEYNGRQDLKRFVQWSGNRGLTGFKP